MAYEANQNPFASTHSFDDNPFDDPTPTTTQTSLASQQRLRDLERREEELSAREAALTQRADHIRRHGRNNWPPFYPLIFHSIADEIPEASRPLITRLYQLWLVLLGTLIVNCVACLLVLTSGSDNGGSDFGASIGYIFTIGVLSFLLWYRPIYNGYMKEQSLYYYMYFFFCGWHLVFSVYAIIGIPGTGCAGLIRTVKMYTRPAIPGAVICTIATVGWTVQGVGNAFYYHQIWNHHKAAGHTIDKAKTELAEHGARSYFRRG